VFNVLRLILLSRAAAHAVVAGGVAIGLLLALTGSRMHGHCEADSHATPCALCALAKTPVDSDCPIVAPVVASTGWLWTTEQPPDFVPDPVRAGLPSERAPPFTLVTLL
jgi:hypothetical protein